MEVDQAPRNRYLPKYLTLGNVQISGAIPDASHSFAFLWTPQKAHIFLIMPGGETRWQSTPAELQGLIAHNTFVDYLTRFLLSCGPAATTQ